MLYAGREQLEYKELQRALKTDAMSSILGSKDVQSEMLKREYPQSGVLFKDTVYLEKLGGTSEIKINSVLFCISLGLH